MSSKKLADLRHTLALRLTLWYAGIFAFSSALAFALIYVVLVSVVQERTDEDIEEDLEEFSGFMQLGGLERVKREIALETQGDEASRSYFRLWGSAEQPIFSSDLSAWQALSGRPGDPDDLADNEDPVLETIDVPGREYQVRRVSGPIAPDVVLEIGKHLEEEGEFIETFLHGFLLTLAVVLLLGAPIGWFMATRALVGVREITRTATEIAGGALGRRVSVRTHGDELDHLAQAFNAMLDRIQALILGMREMTDNLAHDLRSPVARLRASAEMTLSGATPSGSWEDLAASTTEECDRLLQIINTTLDIAEAESGAAKLQLENFDLAAVVLDACEVFQTVAEDKGIRIETRLPPNPCLITADRQRLQRVVANLLDNALKYTAAGGRVLVSLDEDGTRIRLSIQDSGIGIESEDIPRVFQRFYRCDRSRGQPGNGLGLSLAMAFVRAHGGEITVASSAGRGSDFTVVLGRANHDGQLPAPPYNAGLGGTVPSPASS